MLEDGQYQCIHLGCFWISVSPVFQVGRNFSAYVALFDNQFLNFEVEDGKIGSFVCPVNGGTVCVDIFPGFPMSLSNPWLSKFWILLIAIKGLDRKLQDSYLSVKVTCMFRLIKIGGSSLSGTLKVCMFRLIKSGRSSPSGTLKVKTKCGFTHREGFIIQELKIPELWDTTGHELYTKSFLYKKWVRVLDAGLLQVCLNILNVKLKTIKMNKPTLNIGAATDKRRRSEIPEWSRPRRTFNL